VDPPIQNGVLENKPKPLNKSVGWRSGRKNDVPVDAGDSDQSLFSNKAIGIRKKPHSVEISRR
jgi:hypothetical protein